MNQAREEIIHTGIVVYAESSSVSNIPAAVLDLDELHETGIPRVRKIGKQAFGLPRSDLNKEPSEKKNLLRKYSKPLYFGDCIEFDAALLQRNEVIKIIKARVKNFITSEIAGGPQKICLTGIINPSDPRHLYTEYFDRIEIPEQFVGTGYPNVCLDVWIELKYDFNLNRLDYEFHSFRGVADEATEISQAPWNKGQLTYSIVPIEDSDDENYGGLMFAVDSTGPNDKRPDIELDRKFAYLTGPRSFMLIDHPNYKCITPLKNDKLKIGNIYKICCVWNMHEKMYIVKEIFQVENSKHEPLPVYVNEDNTETLKCSVKAHETIPGAYYNPQFKYFDDPKGVLSLLHLTKFKLNSIPVSFIDAGPSRCGQFRFRIDKILGDKKKKLDDFIQKEDIVLNKATGVVVDEHTVFAAEHASLNIRFDNDAEPPPAGVWINFDASYNKDEKMFKITKWERKIEKKELTVALKRMVAKKSHQKQLIFKVKVKICKEIDLDKMLFCSEFGLIDDNLGLVTLEKKNPRAAIYTVWVKCADADVKDNEPRTPFHIIAVGDAVPNDRVEEPVATKEHIELKRRFVEKMDSAAKNGSTEPRASRFSAPKSKNPPIEIRKIPDEVKEQPVKVEDKPVEVKEEQFEVKEEQIEIEEPPIKTSSPHTNVLESSYDSLPSKASRYGQMERGDDRAMERDFEQLDLSARKSPQKKRTGEVFASHSEPSSSFDEGRFVEAGPRERRTIPDYTGVVMAQPGSEGKYDVVETITRLRKHVPHDSSCGMSCTMRCPRICKTLELMTKVEGFWTEVVKFYPSLASAIAEDIQKIDAQKP